MDLYRFVLIRVVCVARKGFLDVDVDVYVDADAYVSFYNVF